MNWTEMIQQVMLEIPQERLLLLQLLGMLGLFEIQPCDAIGPDSTWISARPPHSAGQMHQLDLGSER
jgi:hypothetical protein